MSDTKVSGATTCPARSAHAPDEHDVRDADYLLTMAHRQVGGSDRVLRLTNPTYEELRAHDRPGNSARHDAFSITIGTLHVGGELAEIAFHAKRMHSAARVASTVSAVGTAFVIIDTMAALPEAWGTGDVRREHIQRDLRFAALVLTLRDVLPPAYVLEETAGKRKETVGFQSRANAICAKLTEMKGARAELLVHVDAGMHAAKACLDARIDRKELFASQPALADRYATDAAFKIGFDAVLFAAAESSTSLDDVLSRLRQRDARCDAQVRIGA